MAKTGLMIIFGESEQSPALDGKHNTHPSEKLRGGGLIKSSGCYTIWNLNRNSFYIIYSNLSTHRK